MNASSILNHLDTATALWALGGATVVGLAAQVLKKVLGLNAEKVIQFLVIALGFAVSGLQYILSSHNIPPTVLGLHTAVLVGVAQPLYIYVIKPLDSFVIQVKNYNAGNAPAKTATTTTTVSTPEGEKTTSASVATPSEPEASTEANF